MTSSTPGSSGHPADPFAPPGLAWERVSPRLVAVRLTIGLAVAGVVAVAGAVVAVLTGAAWVWAFTVVAVVFAAWLAWLVPRLVGALGYAVRDDDLLIRRGIMFRRLVVVPYGRLQYLDMERGPLARAYGLASLQLHTASAGSDATIDGLPDDVAERLRDRLAARGEARLAGL
jgi:hypothetical protein